VNPRLNSRFGMAPSEGKQSSVVPRALPGTVSSNGFFEQFFRMHFGFESEPRKLDCDLEVTSSRVFYSLLDLQVACGQVLSSVLGLEVASSRIFYMFSRLQIAWSRVV
jgi:hypothetical protein